MSAEDCILDLARVTVEIYVKERKVPVFHKLEDFKKYNIKKEDYEDLKSLRAGCFVTLHNPELRGCIGTIEPVQDNLAEEIIQNAVSACSEDPRFPAVQEEELLGLDISVDVLGKQERVESVADLDAKRYGVIVSKGFRRGLLLPNIKGVETPEQQISIALRKANISPAEIYEVERFEVKRYEEGI